MATQNLSSHASKGKELPTPPAPTPAEDEPRTVPAASPKLKQTPGSKRAFTYAKRRQLLLRDRPIVSYTSKDGYHVDLENLRHNLKSIADDLNTASALAHEAGDPEFAYALDALFCDVDGMIPAVGVKS